MRYSIGRGGVDRPVRNVYSSFKPQAGVNEGDYLGGRRAANGAPARI